MNPRFLNIRAISIFSILLSIFLLPVFFLTGADLSINFSKFTFFSLAVSVSLIFYFFHLFRTKSFKLPGGFFIFSVLALLAIYVFSAFLSSAPWFSIFGYGYETLTLSAIFLAVVFYVLVACQFLNVDRLASALAVLMGSGFAVAVVQIVNLFYFQNRAFTIVGSWGDVGIFFAVVAIISLALIESLPLSRYFKFAAHLSLIVSAVFLLIVNMDLVWYGMAAASLIMILRFGLSRGQLNGSSSNSSKPNHFPKIATGVFIFCLLFILPLYGDSISKKTNELLVLDYVEVRPSWVGTFDVGKQSLSEKLLLGAGPNRFAGEWELYRPDINLTNYWSTSFAVGVGWLPTAIIETGILGLAVWLIFAGFVLWLSVRLIFAAGRGIGIRLAVALPAIFLWFMAIFYTPSLTIIALTFFFSALVVALSVVSGTLRSREFVFEKLPRATPFIFVGLAVLCVLSINFSFEALKKAYAANLSSSAKNLALSGDLNNAEAKVIKTINTDPSDANYHALAEIKLAELNITAANAASGAAVSDEDRKKFEQNLKVALESARLAQNRNPDNFQNWLLIGRIYALMSAVGIPDSKETAYSFYKKALERSPRNPAIFLEMADFSAQIKDYAKARELVNKALELKGNFVAAVFLLSQIDIAEGKITSALQVSEAATKIAPEDPTAFFRLGLLNYDQKNYPAAARSFERALEILPNYANAEYFLGLSYYFLGRKTDAAARFESLAKSNPGNVELTFILANIKAGREPFAGALPPIDAEPENRREPPLGETGLEEARNSAIIEN